MLLVAVVFGEGSARAQNAVLQTGEIWYQAGMRLESILKLPFIKEGRCYQNFDDFVSCFEGLNSLLVKAQPKLMLVPAQLRDDPRAGRIVYQFGPFRVVVVQEERNGQLTPRQHYELSQRRASTRGQHLREIYEQTRRNPVNFEHMFRFSFALLNSIHPHLQSEYAALALEAIYQSTDPHAKLETEAEKNRRIQNANESFIGIGITLRAVENRLIIHAITPNGPAERAGMNALDVLVAVNGQRVMSDDLRAVNLSLKGELGSSVRLSVRRNGRLRHINLIREDLFISNVRHSIQEVGEKRIGILRIRNFFDDKLCQSLSEVIQQYETDSVDGYVLDLRGNRGGLLGQGNCVASLFLGKKIVVSTRNLVTGRTTHYIGEKEQLTQKPIVVLVNEGTASSSEVVAGALQGHGRGILVGEKTFGKGTVQHPIAIRRLFGFTEDVIKWETRERFFTPRGGSIHKVGITPDIRIVKDVYGDPDPFYLRERELFPQGPDALPQSQARPRSPEMQSLETQVRGRLRARLDSQTTQISALQDHQLLAALDIFEQNLQFLNQTIRCEHIL